MKYYIQEETFVRWFLTLCVLSILIATPFGIVQGCKDDELDREYKRAVIRLADREMPR